jgi:hypothetical protein
MNYSAKVRVQQQRVNGRLTLLADDLTELFTLLGDTDSRLRETVERDLQQIIGQYITDEYLHLGLTSPRPVGEQ